MLVEIIQHFFDILCRIKLWVAMPCTFDEFQRNPFIASDLSYFGGKINRLLVRHDII